MNMTLNFDCTPAEAREFLVQELFDRFFGRVARDGVADRKDAKQP